MKFTNLLRRVILEEKSKFEILFDKLTNPSVDKEGKRRKPPLTQEEFFELMRADPTTRTNNVDLTTASPEELSTVKAGSYTPWIIKHYLTPKTERKPGESGYEEEVQQMKNLFMEDLYKITNSLQKFNRFKAQIQGERDLNKLTPDELYNKVKDFSLEKTKASKSEKEEASKSFKHPGGEIVFRGPEWTVVKISDQNQLGKDAACFYGGYHLEPHKGESRWCTSSPGLNYFERYIKDGPLYVVIKNTDEKFGEKSGLPATRYQFHFPSNQFMDVHDHQIDLVKFLSEPMSELKDYFKPEFAKALTVGSNGEKLSIDSFTSGATGKFLALYGFDELIDSIPNTIQEIQIQNKDNNGIVINIPESFSKFKNLETILFDNCIAKLPDSICELKKLRFIAVMNNKKLRTLPECTGTLPKLIFVNAKGSSNFALPESLKSKNPLQLGDAIWDFEG